MGLWANLLNDVKSDWDSGKTTIKVDCGPNGFENSTGGCTYNNTVNITGNYNTGNT